jgi:hypothetical protein
VRKKFACPIGKALATAGLLLLWLLSALAWLLN